MFPMHLWPGNSAMCAYTFLRLGNSAICAYTFLLTCEFVICVYDYSAMCLCPLRLRLQNSEMCCLCPLRLRLQNSEMCFLCPLHLSLWNSANVPGTPICGSWPVSAKVSGERSAVDRPSTPIAANVHSGVSVIKVISCLVCVSEFTWLLRISVPCYGYDTKGKVVPVPKAHFLTHFFGWLERSGNQKK